MTESSDPKERQHEACMMCCKVLFAIILPPIAVLLEKGCGCELCLNIVLTLLGWIPGMLHAFFVILGGKEYDENMRQVRKERKEMELREAMRKEDEEAAKAAEKKSAEPPKTAPAPAAPVATTTTDGADVATTTVPAGSAEAKGTVVAPPVEGQTVIPMPGATTTNPPPASS